MANKQDVKNAYYEGVYDVISADPRQIDNICVSLDKEVISGLLDWLSNNGFDPDLENALRVYE